MNKIITTKVAATAIVVSVVLSTSGHAFSMSYERAGEILGSVVGALTAPVTPKGGSKEIVDHVQDFVDSYGDAGREMDENKAEKDGIERARQFERFEGFGTVG